MATLIKISTYKRREKSPKSICFKSKAYSLASIIGINFRLNRTFNGQCLFVEISDIKN